MSDPYKTLGVSNTASQDDIKKAYRKLAHQHHPDKTGGDDKKFKEINEAYQILSDPSKRQQYDQFGHVGNGGFNGAGGFDFGQGGFDFGGFSGGGGFEDIFDIFSGAFGGGGFRAPRQERPHKGEDLHLEVRIGKKDLGTTKTFEFEAYDKCGECDGSGVAHGSKMKTCNQCQGAGQVRHSVRTPFGTFSTARVCDVCRGKGKAPEKLCGQCRGTGRVKTRRTMEIRIPSDITNGYVVIAPKQGNAGAEGAPVGDLLVTIRIK